MTDAKPTPKPASPALFATIHFQSDERPDGYKDEDIAELNRLANVENSADEIDGKDPA
jgi:hypothetical protein